LGELVAGLRICDGVLLVVDAIEGVMLMTEKIIKHIIREKLPVVVVINKIDRLIIEMKIPPEDAYLKLKHTLEEINGIFLKCAQQLGMENNYKISPALNNVVFAAAEYGFIFNLELMARKYQERFPSVDPNAFKSILWGDYYFNRETRKFQRTSQPPPQDKKRTFV
jgi:U5 small nuclear ribonucleoprotein component